MMKQLTLEERQEIFQQLVKQQDKGLPIPRSRQIVAREFQITEAQVRAIENEGLEKEWPPLSA
ncbi:MAG: hypothetical protein KatS3mg105_4798 [Gemmatales bacterium]|nr:MAG: hypothetical protein KatS3mg105_4798 [Gemmatales bacterium]